MLGGSPAETPTLPAGTPLLITADITNTGTLPGEEVAQLYLTNHTSDHYVPVKELRGYERISLQPGETATVHFFLKRRRQLQCMWRESLRMSWFLYSRNKSLRRSGSFGQSAAVSRLHPHIFSRSSGPESNRSIHQSALPAYWRPRDILRLR